MKRKLDHIPKLTVSCQIRAGQPFSGDSNFIKKSIDSVVLAGAKSLRLGGGEMVRYAKDKFPHVFVMGVKKVVTVDSPSSGWVTPDIDSAKEVLEAGPDMLVIDGSNILHTEESLRNLILEIRNESDVIIGCDIGTPEEAERAIACGADIVLTTFVQAKTRENKDWAAHLSLAEFMNSKSMPFIAEGGITSESEMREMLRLGAKSVVVGKVIVDPGFNAERFIRAAEGAEIEKLDTLFKAWSGSKPDSVEPLSAHGSSRRYFKMTSSGYVALGAIGLDPRENQAFVELGRHLHGKGIPVPMIYGVTSDKSCYLQEYCRGEDLFQAIKTSSIDSYLPILKKAVDLLVLFQKCGGEGWDFDKSYPYKSFGPDEMKRDFARFKNRFLNNLSVNYEEGKLDAEMEGIMDVVAGIPDEQYSLMHRDFQGRNIIVGEKDYTLIDFQGARRGPIQYDLASLLYQSQLEYTLELRKSLVEYFLMSYPELDRKRFLKDFHLVSIIRLIQSIGSYGIAGLEEGKEYFLKSIPYSLDNLLGAIDTAEANDGIGLPSLRVAILSAKENFNKKI